MVNGNYLHIKVMQHVRRCTVCDPAAVLQYYLDRRRNIPKFFGQTSEGLVRLAEKYDRMARRRGKVLPSGLLLEFVWRSASSSSFKRYESALSLRNVYDAVTLVIAADEARCQNYLKKTGQPHPNPTSWTQREFESLSRFREVYALIKSGFNPTSNRDIEDTLATMEIHCS
jgi:hypothetical protein